MNQSNPIFSGLQPVRVWAHFATLCSVPRPSKDEAALRDGLLAWALARGLAAEVDTAGNLIVRKPATPGWEKSPGVVLQAHLDMVCQKNADSEHDFSHDPIIPECRDGWLVAEKTTLGADNGIGVAVIVHCFQHCLFVRHFGSGSVIAAACFPCFRTGCIHGGAQLVWR